MCKKGKKVKKSGKNRQKSKNVISRYMFQVTKVKLNRKRITEIPKFLKCLIFFQKNSNIFH